MFLSEVLNSFCGDMTSAPTKIFLALFSLRAKLYARHSVSGWGKRSNYLSPNGSFTELPVAAATLMWHTCRKLARFIAVE